MAVGRSQSIRSLCRFFQTQQHFNLLGSSRNYSIAGFRGSQACRIGISSFLHNSQKNMLLHDSVKIMCNIMDSQLAVFTCQIRSVTTQVKAPPQVRQGGAMQVSMLSPGIVYEPYTPREKIPFWKRWFTRSGWHRTKEDLILELKSAYAIQKLRKSGYSKHKFYVEAFDLYKEISLLLANGDKTSLRKHVTEKMFSALKNEIKQRESVWNEVYWELIEPAVKIRTLRARLIGVDKSNLNKVFVQLTLEFLTKQKFEAYNSSGAVVAGDKNKEHYKGGPNIETLWKTSFLMANPTHAYWDQKVQSLGICHRLFYFITKALATHATKPVTLGEPSHINPTTTADVQQCCDDTHPIARNGPENDGDSVIAVEEVDFDAVKSRNALGTLFLQNRVAKKMVSIKDEAEVIDLGKKRRRFSFDKQMSSMKKESNIELRPLKSILRVGSNPK